MKNIKWIIWDFDGTFYSSEKVNNLFEQYSYKYLENKYKKIGDINAFRKLAADYQSFYSLISDLIGIPVVEIAFEVEESVKAAEYIPKNMNIVELIRSLKEYNHCIYSNSTSTHVTQGLKKCGFEDIDKNNIKPFKMIFDLETTRSMKPNVQGLRIIHNFTRSPKREHLVIGDSTYHDIDPAMKFGFQAITVDEFLSLFEN